MPKDPIRALRRAVAALEYSKAVKQTFNLPRIDFMSEEKIAIFEKAVADDEAAIEALNDILSQYER